MLLNEIPVGSQVRLVVIAQKGQVEFESEVVSPINARKAQFGNGCMIKPIKKDDKLVKISDASVSAFITNKDDNREYLYRLTACSLCKFKDEIYHAMYSKDDIKATNRRDTFRVECTYDAVIQMGSNRVAVNGYVHDLSYTGIGLTIEKNAICAEVGSEISISFTVNDTFYRVNGELVRINDNFSSNRKLLGCRFDKEYYPVNTLVRRLQILQRGKSSEDAASQ